MINKMITKYPNRPNILYPTHWMPHFRTKKNTYKIRNKFKVNVKQKFGCHLLLQLFVDISFYLVINWDINFTGEKTGGHLGKSELLVWLSYFLIIFHFIETS